MTSAETGRGARLLFSGLLAACSDPATLFIQLPELEPTVGFLLAFDDLDAAPVSVSDAFEIGPGRALPTSLSIEEGQKLLLLAIDEPTLRFTGVGPRSAPVAEYQLELSSEACPAGRLTRTESDARLRIAAAKATQSFSASASAPSFVSLPIADVGGLAAASVSLPVGPGDCGGLEPSALQPFNQDQPLLLTEETMVRGRPAGSAGQLRPELVVLQLLSAGPDRVVASSRAELLLFDRNQPFVDDASHRVSTSDVPGLPFAPSDEEWVTSWQNLDLGPATPSGSRTLFAALLMDRFVRGDPETRLGFYTALVTLELGPLGLSNVRTATVWAGEVVEVLAQANNAVLALFNEPNPERGSDRDAYVLRGESEVGPWKASLISTNIGARSLRRTNDVQNPHLVGFSLGRLMLGDLSKDPPELSVFATDLTGDADALAAVQMTGGLTVFVGTDRGNISMISASDRITRPLLFRLPLLASACAPNVDACGWSSGTDRVLSMEYFEGAGALAVTFQACEGVVLLRDGDLCPSAFPLPGRTEIGNTKGARYLEPTDTGALLFDVRSNAAELTDR